jgi:leucyl-tRNA synthetase
VVCPHYPAKTCTVMDTAYLGGGHLVASGKFDGMPSETAKGEVTAFVKGKKTVKYHLRDWLISRQRYWGPPIPIIYCKECGTVPVPEKDLPVLLPEVEDFRPKGTGKSPLASVESFVKTKCPQCKGEAERETDVSDTFLDSAWYFLRYPCTEFKKKPFDKLRVKKWLPVAMYIGGHEHAVLHLLYTRFITMALKDMDHLEFEEPFKKFRAHGLITKEGAKMSKSKGNVVNPDEYFVQYGADTVRTYLMFLGPLSDGGDWSDKGIVGISRFFNRLWSFLETYKEPKEVSQELEVSRHQTIKRATESLEALQYNTAIASLMEYSNAFHKTVPTKEQLSTLFILLSPFAPHLAEELWSILNKRESVHEQAWPEYSAKKLERKTFRLVLQVNGKVRDTVQVPSDISEEQASKVALASEKIQKWLENRKPKKVIFVPGRLINVVVIP